MSNWTSTNLGSLLIVVNLNVLTLNLCVFLFGGEKKGRKKDFLCFV